MNIILKAINAQKTPDLFDLWQEPPPERMRRFLNVLRSWLVMVSVIAMGNTVQSFRDHSFLSEKLYTGMPEFGEEEWLYT